MTENNISNPNLIVDKISTDLKEGIMRSYDSSDCMTAPEDVEIETFNQINKDSDISKQNIEDRKSNRDLRERIAKRIFLIMAIELVSTGLLIFALFIIPIINSFGPDITIKLPNLKLMFSIIFVGTFTICSISPNHFALFLKDKNQIKLWHRFTKTLLQIIFLFLGFIVINCFCQTTVIHYNQLIFENNMVHWLLILAETIFVKTTILGGMIIKGLFEVMKLDFKQTQEN